jgi:hypothetical protein
MKKHPRSLRSLLRKASRAERRRASAAARVDVRKPTGSVPVPWDTSKDSCQFFLAAESYSEQPASGAVDPLAVLDERFRNSAGWTPQAGPDPKRAVNVWIGMRRPAREFVAGSGSRFLAIDPIAYKGDAVCDPAAHQEFWDHQMNGRPFSTPFLKSGPAIWKKLGIKISPENSAYMMQMKSVDAETSEAIQAAIWSAFNTAQYPIDIETAVFVLATFMHADPLRKHLVSDEPFAEPYGDRTRYGLRKIYDLPASDDGDEDETKG